jgi:hypothetical protein
MMTRFATISLLAVLATPALGHDVRKAPPGDGYEKVSDLVALPSLMPGLGILYVRPNTLPNGPFLAYDRRGRLVSTIFMIPVEDLQNQKAVRFNWLGSVGNHVTMHFNPGHPGVDVPHYHVIIWHVPRRAEARVAQ